MSDEKREYKPFHKVNDGERKPFRKDGDRPFRKDGDRPFRKDEGKLFRKDGDKPFRKDGDKSFRKGGDKPFRKDGKKPAMPKVGDARRVALNALCDVMMADAYAGIALNKRFKEVELSPEDKRLATNIFYTALENRMRIDHLLNQLVASMPEQIVRAVLHIAAAQLLYMDRIPDHAAVDEAVNIIKRLGREHYAALVNDSRARCGRTEGPGPRRESGQISFHHAFYP